MEKELLAFVFFSGFCLIGTFLSFSLPSTLARFMLIFLFLALVLWAMSFSIYRKNHHNAKIAEGITFFVMPIFLFLVRNMTRLSPFLDGIEFSETRMLIQQYFKQGKIEFSGISHAPFFQTPYLIYVLSSVTGLPFLLAEILFLIFYFVFVGIISIYILKVLTIRIGNVDSLRFLPFLIVFSLISASSLMVTSISYRYLGSFILPLLVFSFQNERIVSKVQSRIVFIFLTIGITLGDPVSSLLTILLFFFYSLLNRDFSLSVYAIIPASYMLFYGGVYLSYFKTYLNYAYSGIIIFFKDLLVGQFSERTLPWNRVSTISQEDSYLVSIAYISLIVLALIINIFHFADSWNRLIRKEKRNQQDEPLIIAGTICLFIILGFVIFAYIGASIQPEVSFSDIRTILLGYSSMLVLFSYGSKIFLSKLATRRFLLLLVIVLLILASFRVIYQDSPKSSQDPILTVEDNGLDLRAIGYATKFFLLYYQQGNILRDFKTNNNFFNDLRFTIKLPYIQSLMSNSTSNFKVDFLMFDIHGLKYPSSYIPFSIYEKALETGLNENLIYNNEAVLVFKKL